MGAQCPKCFCHAEHIFTTAISPKTGERWRIEECPRCGKSFDLELEREFYARKNPKGVYDDRRDTWNDGDQWRKGL